MMKLLILTASLLLGCATYSLGQTDMSKRKAIPDMPENRVDVLLEKVAQDKALLPELYKVLVASDVYVIFAEKPDPKQSSIRLQSFFKDGESFVPFFSSEANLKQATEGMPGEKHSYLITGQVFFSLFKDNELLILNPGCRVTREFRADEFKAYLPQQTIESTRVDTASAPAMFIQENTLEQSLMKAAKDPAHRPQFYRDFVSSDIFIIRHGPPPEKAGKIGLQEDTELKIQSIDIKGKRYIPVFSSITRLSAFIRGEVGYIALNALEFLKITQGAELFLNPGSDYGKEFTREEIKGIIDGSIWRPPQPYKVEKDTQIWIGQPANYPQQLVEALSRLFRGMPEVKSAYLAHCFNPERDKKAHTLIGISVSGRWEEIVAQAGMIVNVVEVPDPPVDFIQIDSQGGGLSDYFVKECKPFYKKK